MVVGEAPPCQGDIWLINFSPVVGREQGGRRPALVLSRDEHNLASAVITVAPLTSSLTMQNHPAAVFLPASPRGAKRDSLILVFQIRTVDKARCERRLYRPGESTLDAVWMALDGHFKRALLSEEG